MPFWFTLVLWAATFAFSAYLANKEADEGQDAKSHTLGDMDIPTASSAKKKPIVLGIQKITSPNLVWYGNFRSRAQTEHVASGWYNTKRVVTGYRYYLSLQMAICAGPVALRRIWYGTDVVWEGYLDTVGDIGVNTGATLNIPHTLGEIPGGSFEGHGTIRFYPGTADQEVDPYLSQFQDPCPAYRDTAYVIFDGLIGDGYYLQTWAFEVEAIPNGLELEESESELLVDNTITSDTEQTMGLCAFKITITDTCRLDYARFKGRMLGAEAGSGNVTVWIFNEDSENPGYPEDLTTVEPLHQVACSRAGWNDELPNDWMVLDLQGAYMTPGTYFLFLWMSLPAVVTEAQTGADEETFQRLLVSDVWRDEHVKSDFEVYGWLEPEAAAGIIDANPMNVAYQAFHDYYGFADEDIDIDGFLAAAETLDTEGNGMGIVYTGNTKISEVLDNVKSQADCYFYLDPVTGQVCVQMIRKDYDVSDLVVLDDSNIVSIEIFHRSDWPDTSNELRLQFLDRDNDYTNTEVIASDRANQQIRGDKIVPVTISFSTLCNASSAVKLAWRELKAVSLPLATARVTLTREMWNLHAGQPVVFTPPSGVSLVMRITSIKPGDSTHGNLEVELIQDVFAGDSQLTPATTDNSVIDKDMIAFTDYVIEDAPYAVVRRQENDDHNRILSFAEAAGRGELGYYQQIDGILCATCDMTSTGTLFSDIDPTDTEIVVATDLGVSSFPTLSDAQAGEDLLGLIRIDNEFLTVRSAVATPEGLSFAVYRGMCDTVPATHAEAATVWILSAGVGVSDYGGTDLDTVSVKLLPYDGTDSLSEEEVTATNFTYRDREDRPYPPRNLELNTEAYPEAVDIDTGATLAAKGVTAEFLRRDYRIYDEVSQLEVDAETVDPTFPAANDTKYCLKVYADDGVTLLVQSAWQTNPSIFVKRTKIIREAEGYMSPLTFAVGTQHNNGGLLEAIQDLSHEAEITSELSDDTWLGNLDTYQTSLPFTAPETGNYTVTLEAALDSDVFYKINGGTWTSCVTAGNTTGTITGVVTGDIIEIRHEDSTTADDELFVAVTAPTATTNAYGVFFFDNEYWKVGGFGRAGFGTGPFGR